MLSYIEISKSNLIHNFTLFRSILNPKTKIACVIKGNAYGHGQNEVAQILEPYADYFQVDDIEELRLLRKVSQKPTFVFGYIAKDDLEEAVKLNGILTVYDIERLKIINELGEKLKIKPKVHIKIDAFLGRQGILLENLEDFVKEIRQFQNIEIDGVYSQFANMGDAEGLSHAERQTDGYQKAVNIFKQNDFTNIKTHISSTAGSLVIENSKFQTSNSNDQLQITNYELLDVHPPYPLQRGNSSEDSGVTRERVNALTREPANKSSNIPLTPFKGGISPKNDIVRLGIGLYGMWPSEYIFSKFSTPDFQLKPVMKWVSHVAQVKTFHPPFTCGYGLLYSIETETKVAIIPQGYSDGYDRGLTNLGEVLIHGTKCKVLGRVAMNMFVVDVSHLLDIQPEDEVVLLGNQGSESISAESIAEKIGTINYEVTTRISPVITRIVK